MAVVQNPETRHRKDDIVHPLRQITTNPMKKGGYGFNKTTLSERKGYKGVVSFPTAIVYFIILGRDRPIIQGIP